jgi:hypothetical protein
VAIEGVRAVEETAQEECCGEFGKWIDLRTVLTHHRRLFNQRRTFVFA